MSISQISTEGCKIRVIRASRVWILSYECLKPKIEK